MTIDRRTHLIEFLGSIAPGCARPLEGDRLELDSLALIQVVMYLEQTYAVRLTDENVEPDDLRSVNGILALLERCL